MKYFFHIFYSWKIIIKVKLFCQRHRREMPNIHTSKDIRHSKSQIQLNYRIFVQVRMIKLFFIKLISPGISGPDWAVSLWGLTEWEADDWNDLPQGTALWIPDVCFRLDRKRMFRHFLETALENSLCKNKNL